MAIQMRTGDDNAGMSDVVRLAMREPIMLLGDEGEAAVVISLAEYEQLIESAETLEDLVESERVLAGIAQGSPTFTLAEVLVELKDSQADALAAAENRG